jgi:hypothetical protein
MACRLTRTATLVIRQSTSGRLGTCNLGDMLHVLHSQVVVRQQHSQVVALVFRVDETSAAQFLARNVNPQHVKGVFATLCLISASLATQVPRSIRP